MLSTYAAMMLVILLLEIGLAVTIYIFKNDAREVTFQLLSQSIWFLWGTTVVFQYVSNGMRDAMQNYGRNGSEGVQLTWDPIQVMPCQTHLFQ